MTTPPAFLAVGQAWSARDYATNAGFIPALGADVLALLDAKAGEDILDLGCGDGVLTTRLMATGANVTGLEPDPSLSAVAAARNISVLQQDADNPFGKGRFDAVFPMPPCIGCEARKPSSQMSMPPCALAGGLWPNKVASAMLRPLLRP